MELSTKRKMNPDQSCSPQKKLLIALIFVIVFVFILGYNFFDVIEKKIERIHCEATPCTDSLCLHWNDSLNRCGTAEALFREIQLKRNEKEKQVNDSLHNLLLAAIKKEDSLITQYTLYTNRVEEQIKAIDIYSKILRKNEMLDSIFNRLRGQELMILEKKRKELIKPNRLKNLCR